MVVTNVHAVSGAALGIHDREINSSGSDISRGDKKPTINISEDGSSRKMGDCEAVNPEQPAGVRKMEAITMIWTKQWLMAAYFLYVISSVFLRC